MISGDCLGVAMVENLVFWWFWKPKSGQGGGSLIVKQWSAFFVTSTNTVLKVLQVDCIPFSAAIAACSRTGQWLVAGVLLEEMRHRKVASNTISCTAAVAACANSSEWARALMLMEEMSDGNAYPDQSTYTCALVGCELSGHWPQALVLLDEMKRKNFPIDGIHVGSVVAAVLKDLGSSAAVEFLKRLRSTWPKDSLRTKELQPGEVIGGAESWHFFLGLLGLFHHSLVFSIQYCIIFILWTLLRIHSQRSNIFPLCWE